MQTHCLRPHSLLFSPIACSQPNCCTITLSHHKPLALHSSNPRSGQEFFNELAYKTLSRLRLDTGLALTEDLVPERAPHNAVALAHQRLLTKTFTRKVDIRPKEKRGTFPKEAPCKAHQEQQKKTWRRHAERAQKARYSSLTGDTRSRYRWISLASAG